VKRIKLTEKEKKLLEESESCKTCGHLECFHNYHCCSFCQVEGCDCEDIG